MCHEGNVRPSSSEGRSRVWRTIVRRDINGADGFRAALAARQLRISEGASCLLDQPAFTVVAGTTRLDLARVTVEELGFDEYATLEEIFAKAKEQGFALCPSEVGPQLRLQYLDQPRHELLVIAMEPIIDCHGLPELFTIWHNQDGRWLSTYYDHGNDCWSRDTCFVFLSTLAVPR